MWEVPFAILSVVPRVGMQLMLRAVSMEKIMSIYSKWGWDPAWGQTYQSRPECLQWAGYPYDQSNLGPLVYNTQNVEAGYPHLTPQPCQLLDDLASWKTVEKDGNAKYEALVTESLDSAHRLDDGEEGQSGRTPSSQRGMVYGGDAHCAALAKLLREAR